jgi:hypothetical protein
MADIVYYSSIPPTGQPSIRSFSLLLMNLLLTNFFLRSQLSDPANTPKSPGQRRLFNVPMVDRDVPIVFVIALFERS